MDGRNNTIAGWVLFGCGAALALSIVGGMIFDGERPEKMGYPIEGVEADAGGGAAAAVPIATLLPKADAAKGADVFKKCAACHNVEKGGANALGPNLWGVVGDKVAEGRGGFAFTDALKSKGGSWTFDQLGEWLKSPKAFAPGTKMTFAGLSNPQDRANVIAYLNTQGDHPLPLPAAPADTGQPQAPGSEPAPTGADEQGAQKAANQPVQNEAQAAKQPAGNVAGDGAPATSGRAKDRRP